MARACPANIQGDVYPRYVAENYHMDGQVR